MAGTPRVRRRMRVRPVVVCIAVLSFGGLATVPLVSQASPGAKLSSLQHKIDVTAAKVGRKRGTERVLSSDIAAWTRRINHLQGRISVLTRREVRIQADLDRKRAELARIQEDLRQQRARLARLRTRLAETRKVLAARLVELYKADSPDMVSVILSARGFADLLERGDFARRVSDADRKIVLAVKTAKEDATRTAKRLTVLEARQQKVTAAILSRRNEIAGVRRELIDTRVGYSKTRAGKSAALSNVRHERHQLEGDLASFRAEQAKISATLRSAQGVLPAGPIRGSGQFIWPVNGPVTSPFCERRAWESCHPGIDIGVPAGTPIRAAGTGRVALMQGEGSSGGYGNFTCVQHTGALSTCYAHQSSFATSMGARVRQGQVIGYVGCTGLCFGAHLHFEVRINGSVTNPMNYL
jgi:murein DD-endopeptidase MepM/ murein hydrolase activator NlpD